MVALGGGFVHGTGQYVCWAPALPVRVAGPYLADTGDFVVRAGHCCERHGPVIIVALGKSVVAIGAGPAGRR